MTWARNALIWAIAKHFAKSRCKLSRLLKIDRFGLRCTLPTLIAALQTALTLR
jgi:hypothetical protein